MPGNRGGAAQLRGRIPASAKVAFTVWAAVWATTYAWTYPLVNFLWLCNIANFLILIGLWRESRLLLSSQTVSVILVQLGWTLDFLWRLTSGAHLVGGTEYMFDPERALGVRAISLYHFAMPVFLLWVLSRLGHDRRAWRLQTAIAWVVLPASFLLSTPDQNVNWVHALFGRPQEWAPPLLHLTFCMVAYPLVLYLPVHLLLRRLFGQPSRASGA